MSTGTFPEEYTRRNATIADLRAELAARGLKWGDARAWGLQQAAAGARPWKPADMPPQAPNVDVITAYLDHLDAGEAGK